ncbi:MAG TPA: sodium:solute symporter family protein [Longimicrobiales bacterium]
MIDLLIAFAFVAYSVRSGFHARRDASRGLDEYFLAGRKLAGWKAGTSMAATQFAADTPLLVTGLIATGGIFLVWRLWIYGISFLVMAFVFSALWRRSGVLTDAELTEIRYSGRGVLALRVLKAVYYGTIINCVVMAMVLVAAVRIAEVFLPWHEWLPVPVFGALQSVVEGLGIDLSSGVTDVPAVVATTDNLISIGVIVAFTALYSMTGGLHSVVDTDALQFGLAIGGTVVYAWIVLREVGGFGALADRVVEIYGAAEASRLLSFAPASGEALMPFLVVIGLQWLFQMNSDGTGYLAQRSMACYDDRQAKIAGLVFTWLQIFFRSLVWLVIGVGLLVLYPYSPESAIGDGFVAAREMTFITGIEELLPVGARGVMLTGMLAALASTVDTHLNWGASYWSNDVYRRLVCEHWLGREAGNRELVAVARLSNLLVLVIAMVIMVNIGSIQTAWYLSLMFGAGMGSVLVLRWLWERINLYSELAAMVTSIIVAPILLFTTEQEWVRLAVMSGVTTFAAIAVTWFTPRTDGDVLRRFYLRVRPVGWWGRTAAAIGEQRAAPVRRLLHGLRLAAIASASVFLLLVGVGRLVIPAPDGSPIVPWVLAALGVGLIPLWYRDVVAPAVPVPAPAPESEPVAQR